MRILSLVLLAIACRSAPRTGQLVQGSRVGEASRPGEALQLRLHFVAEPDSLTAAARKFKRIWNADAIEVNEHAVHADQSFLEGATIQKRGPYASGLYPHNHHFLTFAATMMGKSWMAAEARAALGAESGGAMLTPDPLTGACATRPSRG